MDIIKSNRTTHEQILSGKFSKAQRICDGNPTGPSRSMEYLSRIIISILVAPTHAAFSPRSDALGELTLRYFSIHECASIHRFGKLILYLIPLLSRVLIQFFNAERHQLLAPVFPFARDMLKLFV